MTPWSSKLPYLSLGTPSGAVATALAIALVVTGLWLTYRVAKKMVAVVIELIAIACIVYGLFATGLLRL